MKKILTLLLLSAVTAQAQQISSLPRTNAIGSGDLLMIQKRIGTSYQPYGVIASNFIAPRLNVVPITTGTQLTNTLASAPTNGTVRTLIYIPMNTTVYIPTNQFISLLRPYTDYYLEAGATLQLGQGLGAGEFDFGTIWFSDAGPYSGPTTNYIWGNGNIINSNQSANIFVVGQVGSYLYAEGNQLRTITTHADGSQVSCVNGPGGSSTLIMNFDWYRHDTYDVVDAGTGNNLTLHMRGRLAQAAEQVIEWTAGNLTGNSRAFFEFDTAESVGAGSLIDICDNMVFRARLVSLGAATIKTPWATTLNNGVVEINTITQSPTAVENAINGNVSAGSFVLRNARCETGTNTPLKLVAAGMVVENCSLTPSGSAAAYGITAGSALGVTVTGTVKLDRRVNDFVAVNGSTTGNPLTNTFGTIASPGGTNVFVNIGGGSEQVLIVTNTCLIVVTNSTALLSGKRCALTLYNNQTTNCGVFASAAGQRLFGTDSGLLAGAVAGAHNSITNGRAMRIDFLWEGTNGTALVNHQR